MIIRTFFTAALLPVLATSAWADCARPSGIEGKIIYNADAKIPQYCNGTNWVAWGSGWTENWRRSGSDLYYSGGNVGIGTSSPSVALDIGNAGYVWLSGHDTSDASIEIGQNRTGNGYSYIDFHGDTTYADYGLRIIRDNTGENANSRIVHRGTGDFTLNASELAAIGLETNSIRRMTILNNGNIGIGAANPQSKLHVAGGVLIHSNLDLRLRSTSTDPGDIVFQGDDGSEYGRVWSSVGNILFSGGALGNQMTYTESGNLYIAAGAYKPGGGSWAATSDERLKDITGDYTAGLAAIAALKPVRFTYKKDNPRNEPSDREFIGLIAQDAMKVMPELVSLRDDGYYDVDSSALNFALINAVKHLNTAVQDLNTANARLVERLERLEQVGN